MHLNYPTALVAIALVSSVVLVMARGDRIFPIVATAASALEALIAFELITFSVRSFRIDIVLPALLVLAGVVCWARMSTKGQITASTLVTVVGTLQLLAALRAI